MALFPTERPYLYRKMSKYPGMSPKDRIVWNQFIEQFPGFSNEVYYNFRVGDGLILNDAISHKIHYMAQVNAQLRIDALTVHPDYIRIIELKPFGSCTAIGQLIAYDLLLRRKYANLPPIKPTMICFRSSPDIGAVMNALDFEVYTVPFPEDFQI